MPGRTEHYGLSTLGVGDQSSDEGYKYTDSDRQAIDRLLRVGAETHRHDGGLSSLPTLVVPTLTQSAAGGSLPASTRVYYKYTLVDLNGLESEASSEVFVDTPDALLEPAAPTLVPSATGGSLLPGQYHYVLTAWRSANTQETKALRPNVVTVPYGTLTNRVSLTMPSLPAGASGFNIYRRAPGDSRYFFLASQTGAAAYIDTGAVEPNCNRTTPVRNTTNGSNSVTVNIGTVPEGNTWRVYRTTISGYYQDSLLHHVIEETSEGSGIITGNYQDLGLATRAGAPPESSQYVNSPSKIIVTDAEEVQGWLPMSVVSGFPDTAVFRFEGQLAAAVTGKLVWVCEYPRATIIGVRAALGRGHAPASQEVIVDVNHGTAVAVPVYTSLFAAANDRPRIAVGQQVGTTLVPTARKEIFQGEVLTVDLDQVGGGATPTDSDLTVTVYMYAYGWTTQTHFPSVDAFSPPGLRAWYDVSALALANGNPVTSWTDMSGNGRHAVQATSTKQPTYISSSALAKPTVRFDGTTDLLRTAAFALAQPFTAILVARCSTTGGTHTFFDGGSDLASAFQRNTSGLFQLQGDAGSRILVGPKNDGAFHIFVVVFNGTSGSLRMDGPSGAIGNAGVTALTALTIGMTGNQASSPLNGDISELLLYSGVLSTYDLNAIGRYLSLKWWGSGSQWDDIT